MAPRSYRAPFAPVTNALWHFSNFKNCSEPETAKLRGRIVCNCSTRGGGRRPAPRARIIRQRYGDPGAFVDYRLRTRGRLMTRQDIIKVPNILPACLRSRRRHSDPARLTKLIPIVCAHQPGRWDHGFEITISLISYALYYQPISNSSHGGRSAVTCLLTNAVSGLRLGHFMCKWISTNEEYIPTIHCYRMSRMRHTCFRSIQYLPNGERRV